jgi:arylformamidase
MDRVNQSMKLIDLSILINENTPLYPGDKKPKFEPTGDLEKDGFQAHYISFNNHIGTHIDAPSHMFAGGRNLEQMSLKSFAGNGVYIRVDKGYDLEKIKKVSIQRGDIVLFHTGMSDRLHEADYYKKYPGVPEDVAHYLVAKKVKMVGVDTGGIDHDLSVHKVLLQNEILIIENLTNLAVLAAKQFKVYAFPLKLQLDASPVRVVAEII